MTYETIEKLYLNIADIQQRLKCTRDQVTQYMRVAGVEFRKNKKIKASDIYILETTKRLMAAGKSEIMRELYMLKSKEEMAAELLKLKYK